MTCWFYLCDGFGFLPGASGVQGRLRKVRGDLDDAFLDEEENTDFNLEDLTRLVRSSDDPGDERGALQWWLPNKLTASEWLLPTLK